MSSNRVVAMLAGTRIHVDCDRVVQTFGRKRA
jgi:hypothetical protein